MTPAIAEIELLIRKPARAVYGAFVDPASLTQFWLSKVSEPLAPNRRVRWEFRVEGAAQTLEVLSMLDHRLIRTAWDDGTTIDFGFEELEAELTRVRVTQAGFTGTAEEVLAKALDATQGFALVLCELKALLEQNITLHAVDDKARSIELTRGRRCKP
jgi:uncharacterized protein YndB with AHSA1/START domain